MFEGIKKRDFKEQMHNSSKVEEIYIFYVLYTLSDMLLLNQTFDRNFTKEIC